MPRCAIPGCRDGTTIKALVCTAHGVQIWAHVESVRSKTGFHVAEAVERHLTREERQAELNAQAVRATRAVGDIYFLALDDKVKVGWTSNLEQRMKSYPPHSRLIVTYPGSRADERDLHRTLAASRVAGREWYERTPHIEATIREAELRMERQYAAEAEERKAERLAAHPPTPPRVVTRRPTKSEIIQAMIRGEHEPA